MEKLVIVSDKPLKKGAPIVREIGEIPGVEVTSVSKSFIDVDVKQPRSVVTLRALVRQYGLSVEDLPEAELMEPISPFRAL